MCVVFVLTYMCIIMLHCVVLGHAKLLCPNLVSK